MTRSVRLARRALGGVALALALAAPMARAEVSVALEAGHATVSGPSSDFVGGIDGSGGAYGVRFGYALERFDLELGYRRMPDGEGQLQIACPGGCGPFPPEPVGPLTAVSLTMVLRPFDEGRFGLTLGLNALSGGADAGGSELSLGLRYAMVQRARWDLSLVADAMDSASFVGVSLAYGR